MDASHAQFYLTGKGNFRESVAVTQPYKGNRVGHKPHHYQAIRDHLVNEWGAEVTCGIEADDALGIAQTEESVICSIDKDLLMIPGRHYNWQRKEYYEISEWEGWRNFYTQLLTGDRTDNILGVWKDTPKFKERAHVVLNGLAPEEMKCIVGMEYALEYDNPEERMQEAADLLWIQREVDDRWII